MSEKVKGLSDDEDDYEEEVEKVNKSGKKSKSKKTDFMAMTGNLLTNINYKVAFLLFIMGMIVFSDVFIDGILSGFSDTVDAECTTTKGTMLQLMFMTIAYILIDLLVQYEWL